jgi:hypothetical protein
MARTTSKHGAAARTLTKTVDDWNAKNPVGTPVTVRKDDGTIVHSITRSEAWLLGDHTPVVMVDGISGGYLLERVKPERRDGLGKALVADTLYYVQDSRSHVGNCVSWWCPNGQGYTCDIDKAGTYTGDHARTLRDTDVAWPVDVVLASAQRFVDWQRLRNVGGTVVDSAALAEAAAP